jgi:glycosyltransferase involved in cell wall biosynthesis
VTPIASVLLPFRNVADTLAEAVESLLEDRSLPVEVLAVDDGSTDDGASLVRALAARDPRVISLRTEGIGIVGALELARAHAHPASRYIARMDGDDVALPGRLRLQIEHLERCADVAVSATRVEAFPSDIVGEGLARYVAWQNDALSPSDHQRELFVEAPVCHPSVVMRRDVLARVGGYRETVWAEDYDLWLRFDATGSRIEKLPRTLLRWRQRAGRLTWTHPRYEPARFIEAKAHYLAPRVLARGLPLSVWGAGPTGKRALRALEPHGVRAARFVDIDPAKMGRVARGAVIEPVSALVRGETCVLVAVGAQGARALIRAALDERGFVEGDDYWCVA